MVKCLRLFECVYLPVLLSLPVWAHGIGRNIARLTDSRRLSVQWTSGCPLIVIVKLWAQSHDINDACRATLSSYSLVLMVIHFLQCEY